MARVSDKALSIVSQKPRFWQHKFFAQVLTDEIEKCVDVREAHRRQQPSLPEFSIAEENFPTWFREQSSSEADRIRYFSQVTQLLSGAAFGSDGTEQDIDYMADLAIHLGETYCGGINWSQQFRSLSMPRMYQPLLNEMALASNTYIDSIETLPQRTLDQLAPLENSESNGPFEIIMLVQFENPRAGELDRESDLLIERYGRKFS